MLIPPETHASSDLRYELIRSRRRTLSLIVRDDGSLEIRCPLTFPRGRIDQFVRDKASWIQRKRHENRHVIIVGSLPPDRDSEAFNHLKLVYNHVIAEFPVRRPTKLTIRDLRSRWGSCSSQGHISLNSRCFFLPEPIQEYVILHELCHLVHLNHSQAFWQLMENYLPDARMRRKSLNYYRLSQEGKDEHGNNES